MSFKKFLKNRLELNVEKSKMLDFNRRGRDRKKNDYGTARQ